MFTTNGWINVRKKIKLQMWKKEEIEKNKYFIFFGEKSQLVKNSNNKQKKQKEQEMIALIIMWSFYRLLHKKVLNLQ